MLSRRTATPIIAGMVLIVSGVVNVPGHADPNVAVSPKELIAAAEWRKECSSAKLRRPRSQPQSLPMNVCVTFTPVREQASQIPLFFFGMVEVQDRIGMLIGIPCDDPPLSSFAIDGGLQVSFSDPSCGASCCHQVMIIEHSIIAKMKAGKQISFVIKSWLPAPNRIITLSLGGFAAAFDGSPEKPSTRLGTDPVFLSELLAGWPNK